MAALVSSAPAPADDEQLWSAVRELPPPDPSLRFSTTRVGAYPLEACIGSGAFGSVDLCARAPGTRDRLVVKHISKKAIARDVALARPRARRVGREIAALRRLAPSGADDDGARRVCALVDVLHSPSHVHVVLQYGGADLYTFIAAHLPERVPEPLVVEVVGGVARALAHCHARGVAHLDVKPENVCVAAATARARRGDERGERGERVLVEAVRLVDFGLCYEAEADEAEADEAGSARAPDDGDGGDEDDDDERAGDGVGGDGDDGDDGFGGLAARRAEPPCCAFVPVTAAGVARKRWRAKGFVGSLGFAAPEVIGGGGARGYDPTKADAWSLGAVALEMLAGNEFFDGKWLAAYRAAPAAASIRGAVETLREDEKVRWPSAGAQEFALALLDDEPRRRCDVPRALGLPWLEGRAAV